MKVLFTADLHIKIGQKSVPKDWARNRYQIMYRELERVKHEYGVDYEIHGGDIFDKMPNLEELGSYLGYIAKQKNPIYIYDGNHEATRKGHTFFDLLGDVLNSINPQVTLITDYYNATEEFPFDVVPYCKLKDYEKNIGANFATSHCLLTHVRGEIPPHVKPEVDLSIFDAWPIVFAGDLHAHSNSQRNIVYPGSPVTVTFHRKEVTTGVIVIETKDWTWEWVEITVPQLIRKTVDSEDLIIKTDYNHTIYELEGDAIDLAKISMKGDLLDKKLVKHDSKAALELKGMTIKEELALYLKEIVSLDEHKLLKALEVYDDYINESEMG